ncbi:hypothetical protein BDD12DRAFT_495880 [Trichophaea hybrida]|nr:hypothetical protein BDD12DRAFT_495880 [Trichophaea hybrida]
MSSQPPKPDDIRFDIFEGAINHLIDNNHDEARKTMSALNKTPNKRIKLKNETEYRCPVCHKAHSKFLQQMNALSCQYCNKSFNKREQVTKHEIKCSSNDPTLQMFEPESVPESAPESALKSTPSSPSEFTAEPDICKSECISVIICLCLLPNVFLRVFQLLCLF